MDEYILQNMTWGELAEFINTKMTPREREQRVNLVEDVVLDESGMPLDEILILPLTLVQSSGELFDSDEERIEEGQYFFS